MTRTKRTSAVFEKATHRMTSLRSIDPNLELSEGLSLAEYEMKVQTLQTTLAHYNTLLSSVDEAAGQVAVQELMVRQYSENMLMAIALRYGKDSLQYMQAGGKKRKPAKTKSTSKPTGPVPTEPIPTTPMTAAMN
jgi:hypothetical protein